MILLEGKKVSGMERNSVTLEAAAFAAWLHKQPYHTPVGYVAVPGRCPLACWLSAVYGVPCEVGTTSYRCEGWEKHASLPLPDWAVRFSFQIDHLNKVRVGAGISKAQAQWVLARAS